MVGMLAIFSAIAGTIQESGFTSALANQKEIRHEDYNAVFWFSVLTGVAFYILLFFCAPLIADFYGKEELIGLSRLLFLSFVLGGIGIAPNAYLFKKLMAKERAKIDVFSLICSGIVGVTLALNGFAYYGLAIQTTTYIGVGSLLKLFYSPWKPSLSFSWKPLKAMFGFSSKLILTNIFTQVNNNIFSVVIGKFYTPTQLGFYSQGQKWMGMGNMLIGGMITGVAQPVLVEVKDDAEREARVFRKMVRFGAFVSFPAMLGLAFVAPEFIEILLGRKWIESVPFLQLFCLWGAIGYMWNLYTSLLVGYGRSDVYLGGIILTGLLQISVVAATYTLGIYAMVIGYVIVYYASFLYWQYFTRKHVPVRAFQIVKDIIPYLGASLISILITAFVVMHISNIYIIFALKIIVVAISYAAILWIGGSTIFKDAIKYVRHENN